MSDPVAAIDPAWDLAQKLATGGATAVILVLLVIIYFLNKERREAIITRDTLAIEGLKAQNRTANALEAIHRSLKSTRRRGRRSQR